MSYGWNTLGGLLVLLGEALVEGIEGTDLR